MKICCFFSHINEYAVQDGISFDEAARRVRAFGIEGVEANYADISGEGEAMAFATKMAGYGFSVPALHHFCRITASTGEAERYIDAAAKLGAHNAMILPETAEDEAGRLEMRARIAGPLDKLSRYADARGVKLSLEDFSQLRAPYSLAEDFAYLLAAAPKLCMTFDTGNFAFNREDALHALVCLHPDASQLSHVHLKNFLRGRDVPPQAEPTYVNRFGDRIYAAPISGDGSIPMTSIFEYLREIGYDGWVSIENGGVYPAGEGLRLSAAWIKSQIGM